MIFRPLEIGDRPRFRTALFFSVASGFVDELDDPALRNDPPFP